MGDTYIKPLFALLLHCRTKVVSDCRFGYLQAQPPVYEAGKMSMGALVLLAPDTGDPIPVEVMRMVSAQLIEEPELIEEPADRSARRSRAAVGRKAGSSVLRTRRLSIKGSGNAENILHCCSFCAQNRIYRENTLL